MTNENGKVEGSMGDALRRSRLGTTLGLGLLLLGQLRFESWTSRVVLGRWSVFAFAAICLVAIAFAASLVRSIVLARSTGPRSPHPAAGGLDAGFLLLGLAYLLAALDDPEAGGRLLELDVFGSVYEPSALLELGALAAFVWAGLQLAWSRWAKTRRQLVLGMMLVMAFLLAGEAITRFWVLAFPRTQGFPTASTEIWMRRYVEYNTAGFRDRERSVVPAPGMRRVLVIGDSFAFAQGVDDVDDRVSDRLERALATSAGAPVEVFNVAAPYTHTLQHIGFLEQGLEYAPDVVVLLYVFNDIFYLQDGNQPGMVGNQPGGLLARLNPVRAIFTNSYLYQQVYLRFRHLYWQFAPRGELPSDPYESPDVVTRHLVDLARFVDLGERNGVAVRIAPFNPRILLDADRGTIDRFVARMVEAGLPVWPVADAYGDADYGSLIVSQMDHHPSERANELLAEALAPQLTSLLLKRAADAQPGG